jgi:hypothetical protein
MGETWEHSDRMMLFLPSNKNNLAELYAVLNVVVPTSLSRFSHAGLLELKQRSISE